MDYIAAALAPEGESSEEYRAGMIADRAVRVPMGRVAQGDDIARMAAFLVLRGIRLCDRPVHQRLRRLGNELAKALLH